MSLVTLVPREWCLNPNLRYVNFCVVIFIRVCMFEFISVALVPFIGPVPLDLVLAIRVTYVCL